ncbi:hypothetical protein IPA_02800 [Ignicoccus pacificus DSM 13166]|uniref:HD Cas3-type domain-containing protein n=1 Tax=Ignicoccus pacificus DSM 13166 TaxID=940294 RepID=A0A977KAS9_9CREN|nr:hypothetical protein IPA_02800 [Ignicoccus pacificus DSM 13166]
MCKEPLSFYDRSRSVEEPLYCHSALIVLMMNELFEKELRALSRKVKGIEKAAYLVAILHDIGKVGIRRDRGGKSTFPFHEALSAYMTYKWLKDDLLSLGIPEDLLGPTIYAVAMHHHAMRDAFDMEARNIGVFKIKGIASSRLAELFPSLKETEGKEVMANEVKNKVLDLAETLIASRLKREAFVLAGFVSVADSAAALLFRGKHYSDQEPIDSTAIPKKFIGRALEEKGVNLSEFLSRKVECDKVWKDALNLIKPSF